MRPRTFAVGDLVYIKAPCAMPTLTVLEVKGESLRCREPESGRVAWYVADYLERRKSKASPPTEADDEAERGAP
jgi:hypothetical protein